MKKACSRCHHLEKPLSWFKYDSRSGRNHPYCVTCAAKMSIVRRGQRLCRKCDQDKPLAEFPFSNREAGWRRHECHACHNARMKRHYLENKPRRLRLARERYRANPSKKWTPERRARANLSARRYRADWWRTILNHYGQRCACCGEGEAKFLTFDHRRNDGAHVRKVQGGASCYRWIIKNGFPKSLRILCYNCNCGRARNGGTCPHKQRRRR